MPRFPTRWFRCRSSRSDDWVPVWLGLFVVVVLDDPDPWGLALWAITGGLVLVLFQRDRRRGGGC